MDYDHTEYRNMKCIIIMIRTCLIIIIFHTTPGITEPAVTGLDYNDADIIYDVNSEGDD